MQQAQERLEILLDSQPLHVGGPGQTVDPEFFDSTVRLDQISVVAGLRSGQVYDADLLNLDRGIGGVDLYPVPTDVSVIDQNTLNMDCAGSPPGRTGRRAPCGSKGARQSPSRYALPRLQRYGRR